MTVLKRKDDMTSFVMKSKKICDSHIMSEVLEIVLVISIS